MMTRTVPVNWCATGGSDTHHKRVVHKDLHEKISEDRKQAERDFRKASVDGRKKRYENTRGVELKCQAVLHRLVGLVGLLFLGGNGDGDLLPSSPFSFLPPPFLPLLICYYSVL